MAQDWSFQTGNNICNFRSAGVLVRDGKLLVQRDRDGTDFALPGGHVQIGESSADSLIREYKEETGAKICCERLLWIEECFWEWNGRKTNTIAFYYQIRLEEPGGIPIGTEFVSQKDNGNVLLGWMPLEHLEEINIYPSFIKEKLFDIKPYPEHFVTHE